MNRIGRYRVLRVIGRGGQGTVHLGYDDRLQRRVAIKRYRLPGNWRQRRRVLTEARTLAGIDHPRVVRIHDLVNTRAELALVTQFVAGCDLEQVLRRGPLPLAGVLSLATDIAAGLAAVLQAGIVHGDLKPSNILVTEEGRALLADFGIACAAAGKPATFANSPVTFSNNPATANNPAGSPAAVAPEQLRGEPVDARSDLFALGCLLYRMIAGRHPFIERETLDVGRLLESNPPPLPVSLADGTPVPAPLQALVERLLRKSPAERYDNVLPAREILHALLSEQPRALDVIPVPGLSASSLDTGEGEEAPGARAFPPPFALPTLLPFSPPFTQPFAPLFTPPFTSPFTPPVTPPPLSPRRGCSKVFRRMVRKMVRKMARGKRCFLARPTILLVIGLCAVLATSAAYLLQPQPRLVDLQVPQVVLGPEAALPRHVTVSGLREVVCRAAARSDGRLRFYRAPAGCPQGSPGRAANLPPPTFHERLQLRVRCMRELCLVDLTRVLPGQGREHYGQAVLLPGMPAARWRAVIGNLVGEVYASRGGVMGEQIAPRAYSLFRGPAN